MLEISARTNRCQSRSRGPHLRAALISLLFAVLGASAFATGESTTWIEGVVLDREERPVAGARVTTEGIGETLSGPSVSTDADGRFSIELAPGDWRLRVSHPDYMTLHRPLTVEEGTEADSSELELRLESAVSVEESIVVMGIRAGEQVPVTKRDLDRDEIEALSYGQDVPALLEYTPSMTWYSDSGIGSNYSYFSLRGIQQTRINMTFDGAPLNDPAEHALYFNNFHDFTSTVASIQIQRGVGTSSVGTPSYGGSVNFSSRPPSPDTGGDVRLALGSYDTRRASVGYGTGLLDSGFHAFGRVSMADTDGYRDDSGTDHSTFFLDLGWQGDRSSLKLVSFSGDVETQLAFLAVDPETLSENPRFNPLTEEDRDNFGQDFVQLKYTRALGSNDLLTASLYYNGAAGWFRLWDDPVAQNELLQFGIDQSFVGSMVTLSRTRGPLSTTFGVHYNDFSGDHNLDIEGARIYENTGFKQTANAFVKAEYQLGPWLLFGDLQYRWAEFSYEGDVDLASVDWRFLDPRIGVRRTLLPGMSLYASIGTAQREPTRLDLLLGEDNATVPHDLEAVKPEELLDFELGLDLATKELALQTNLYAMEFTNEIALSGELSEVGLPLRRNVDESYRRGLEIDLKWQFEPRLSLLHSANLSDNRIREWTQFYDVYDEAGNWIGSEPIRYSNVKPLLTPEAVVNLGVEWSLGEHSITLMGRYIGDSQLDNTGLEEFRAPAYANLDLRASVGLGFWTAGRPRLSLFVNNLLDKVDQYPSGYSYQFITRNAAGLETLDGIPFYYPLATRNAYLTLAFDL